jgi:uncharacterized membrane protein YeaQ/YmgE (transglycosylase-associated protein family)
MSVIGWLIVGLIEGFIASWVVDDEGPGLVVDLVLGAAGALMGGLMFSSFGASLAVLNLFSLVVAVVGAVVVLIVYHGLVLRRPF